MTTGLKRGDKRQVINTLSNNYDVGDIIEYTGRDGVYYGFERLYDRLYQVLHWHQFMQIEEDTNMAKKQSNPKNFRNGDVIKVSNKDDYAALVYVKFGENYYNLTAGGQMKACRYLPPGTKEIITNLSGMGKFFLMSEEELEEQAGKYQPGVDHTSGEDYTITWGGSSDTTQDFITATDIIKRWEDAIKYSQDMIKTDTTEEK